MTASWWGGGKQAVLGEALFRGATDHGSQSYSHLVDLYVERSHLLWKVR